MVQRYTGFLPAHKNVKMSAVLKTTVGVFSICILLLSLMSCDAVLGIGSSKRVLFVGNSYLAMSNIPGVFKELAKSGGHKVEIGTAADKGGSFAAYAHSVGVRQAMQSSKWDYVVLQEQSQIPSIPHLRASKMYPGARELVRQIRALGAIPVFFQSSGNRNGWPENSLFGYENMQLAIIQGYSEIADELKVPVAPVGHAWYVTMKEIPQLDLWMDDRHPNDHGAYLAACTLYATLFRESPEKSEYTATLPIDLAKELQKLAAETVLQNLEKWNL